MKYQTPVAQLFFAENDILTNSVLSQQIVQEECGLGKQKTLAQLLGEN